jgi:predicted dienelactone hydrolase
MIQVEKTLDFAKGQSSLFQSKEVSMRLTKFLLAFCLCTSATPLLAADPIGVRKISVVSQDNPRPLAVTVWYPAAAAGAQSAIAQDRIFEIPAASKDAQLLKGRFPLVLLSHGSGSRVEGMGWIAAGLAEAGFIVAGPNHPGTTSGDSTPAATPKIWERTGDISAVITSLSADPQWKASIDPTRIGVLGFSLGGTTVLELAGARADLSAYIRYCGEHADMMDCRWFAGGRGYAGGEQIAVEPFDLKTINRARFEQSNRDPRIASVVAVDPGLATVLTPQSLKNINIPITIVNLGSSGRIPVAVLAEKLAKQVPNAAYTRVDNSDHFSFLPVCKQGAADFLKSVGELDPICEDAGRPRIDIHEELTGIITRAFERTLKSGH